MVKYCPELLEELLYKFEHYGYPANIHGYHQIEELLYNLSSYVTLLTVDCYPVHMEFTLEKVRSDIKRINESRRGC